MKYYLEYSDEKSNKFWSVEVRDNTINVAYGKVGSKGNPKAKSFSSSAEALQEARKQAKAKIKKGYVDKTLEHFSAPETLQQEAALSDKSANVNDDGQLKPWHSPQYWDSYNVDMELGFEELRNPDHKKLRPLTEAKVGIEMPDEVVEEIEYKLVDYARERKVLKLIEGLNKLRIGNVNGERMQKVLDKTLWSAVTSHWDVSEDHIEIIRILLEQGAQLSERIVKFISTASEEENLKSRDCEITGPYSSHLAIQKIGIFKRYIAAGSKPEKFMECVDSYFEDLFAEAAEVAERVLRVTVDKIKAGGDESRSIPIPNGKFPPSINGLRVEVIGDDILVYPDIYSFNSWAKEEFKKIDDIDRYLIKKRLTKELTKTFEKLIDEGLFDEIANGKIALCYGDTKNILASRILDTEAHEAMTKEILGHIEELEKSQNWELNATSLSKDVVPALNAGLETTDNRILNLVLAHLYSGNPEAEEAASKLLSDYYSYSPRWRYEYALYYYRNFEFEIGARWMRELAAGGYSPAKEMYEQWLTEGTFEPPKPQPVYDKDDDDDFKASYTPDDMFIETDSIIARADNSGHIKLRFKVEGEQAYSDALEFINNLTFKGYSKKHKGLQYSIYFLAEPMSNYPAEAFFLKASQYPSLHEKMSFYVDTVMYDYDHYHDQNDEESTVIGTYAAKQLILADAKNLHMAIKLANATDGEHEKHAYYFTFDVVRRYGINPQSIPAIYELSLTCDHEDPNLPKEVYKNAENLEALMTHYNTSTHHFKDGKLLRFVRGMFDYDYKKALAKIVKLYEAEADLKNKNIYADFYNLILQLAEENTEEKLGTPLAGVSLGISSSVEERLGDQSCVITADDAKKRGAEFNQEYCIEGRSVVVFNYMLQLNSNIVDFFITNRDAIARIEKRGSDCYAIYGEDQYIMFNEKWVVDMRATEYRNGAIFYDGKSKPVVIYGICDYAEIIRVLGKKNMDPAALINLRDANIRFENEAGSAFVDNPAAPLLYNAYESVFHDKFNRAFMDIAKIKPEDGDVYIAALVFKATLLRMKKDWKGIAEVYTELLERDPAHTEIWEHEIEFVRK